MALKPIQETAEGVILRLRVQPRSSHDEVAGFYGDAVRVRLTAPPTDGAANEALIRFLSDRLTLSRSLVRLDSGHTSRSKVITLIGAKLNQVVAGLGLSGIR